MTKAVASVEILPKVLEVLNLIVTAIDTPTKKSKGKLKFDAYSYAAAEIHEYSNVHTVGKKCVELVNQSICSQRYEQAAKLLCILCGDSTVYENFLFKATMVILENLQLCDKDEVIYRFLKEIQNLAFVNKKETVLEYIQCGIRNNFSNLSSKLKGFNFVKKLRKHSTIDPLFEAYAAYIDYRTYLHADEVFPNSERQASQASQISMEGVITKFKSLIRIPGDWDIFVLKLVEMLETNGKVEEIGDILYDYAKCNPNHLNGHIYLCEYLRKHDPDSEILTDHLKIIAELCPSDERVLLLIEKWNAYDDELRECLKLIFMFLDYPSNGKNIEPWKILSNLLDQAKSKITKEEMIKHYWQSRSSSWHWMYFNPPQVHNVTQEDFFLISIKTSILSYFDKNHQYIKEIQLKFPKCQIFL
ncbi:TATA box-binding protein-associated factor like protein [Argiope bruennichi]|uniref:TATA box-binding protein-associated factor like protein n=2 Tax=Argiope bruennichi TaxID=94029 RepID=A0A8T0G1F1_ARGBR|nr:TATA box-binding protein-associated factor like protein [Argiope bruennichi]